MALVLACGDGDASAPDATAAAVTTPEADATAAASPGASATVETTAEPGATAAASPDATPATALPLPDATPAAPEMILLMIAFTDGEGVAVRDACADAARVSAPGRGIREGAPVEFVEGGREECGGWTAVVDGAGRQSWVRDEYLAFAPPALTLADATAAADATATPVAPPGTPYAMYYGLAAPGVEVAALIDGTECVTTAANADGEWLLYVYRGACDGAARSGAVVEFTLNGALAQQSLTWRSGIGDFDVALGLQLTIAPAGAE